MRRKYHGGTLSREKGAPPGFRAGGDRGATQGAVAHRRTGGALWQRLRSDGEWRK